MTSNDVKASFKRRTALGSVSAPGYMLADVTGYDTPDPLTFVVHLKQPGGAVPGLPGRALRAQGVETPPALAAHAGSDMAQTYLKTHDAGTGPFTMTDFVPGDHYTLTAFAELVGRQAAGDRRSTSRSCPTSPPSSSSCRAAQLQMILHGLSKDDIASYENNPKFQVQRFPANFKTMLMVNQNKGVFKDQALRTALQSGDQQAADRRPGLRRRRRRLDPDLPGR